MAKVKQVRDILPAEGIWTVEDLADYFGMRAVDLYPRLEEKGIPVLHLGSRYKAKLIRLEDLRAVTNG